MYKYKYFTCIRTIENDINTSARCFRFCFFFLFEQRTSRTLIHSSSSLTVICTTPASLHPFKRTRACRRKKGNNRGKYLGEQSI